MTHYDVMSHNEFWGERTRKYPALTVPERSGVLIFKSFLADPHRFDQQCQWEGKLRSMCTASIGVTAGHGDLLKVSPLSLFASRLTWIRPGKPRMTLKRQSFNCDKYQN